MIMNKRRLHHTWVRLKKVSYWYFLAACLLSGFVAVTALRHNNLTALALRNQVLQVDKQNGDTEAALKKLRQYVYAHMNTNLASSTSVYPPIQLKYRYERLVQAEKDRVAAAPTDIYHDAQKYCEKVSPESFFGRGRLPCVQSYLDSHPLAQAQPIPDSLYKFDFVSPVWSPDLAGISLVLFVFFLMLFLIRFLLNRWFQYQLGLKN